MIPYSVFLFIILKLFPIQKPLQLFNDLFHQGLYGSNSFKGFPTKLSIIVNVISFKAFIFFLSSARQVHHMTQSLCQTQEALVPVIQKLTATVCFFYFIFCSRNEEKPKQVEHYDSYSASDLKRINHFPHLEPLDTCYDVLCDPYAYQVMDKQCLQLLFKLQTPLDPQQFVQKSCSFQQQRSFLILQLFLI